MAKYRKKPVVVEAFRWARRPGVELPRWFIVALCDGDARVNTDYEPRVSLKDTWAAEGNWIVRETNGELRSYTEDDFEDMHDVVNEE